MKPADRAMLDDLRDCWPVAPLVVWFLAVLAGFLLAGQCIYSYETGKRE